MTQRQAAKIIAIIIILAAIAFTLYVIYSSDLPPCARCEMRQAPQGEGCIYEIQTQTWEGGPTYRDAEIEVITGTREHPFAWQMLIEGPLPVGVVHTKVLDSCPESTARIRFRPSFGKTEDRVLDVVVNTPSTGTP